MSNLPKYERFDRDGLELVVDTDSGLAYASISAIARMLETPETTVRDALKNPSRNLPSTMAEIPTATGFKTSRLFTADAVFRLAIKYHPLLAEAMGSAGANLYMLKLAGYEVKVAESSIVPKDLSRREILRLALEAEDRILALEAQIDADADATTLGKAIAKAPNNIRIGDFAKSIDCGQNRYFSELRDDGIIQQTSNLPYQAHINAGYFVVTQIIAANGRTYPVALITPKGQQYLVKRHKKYISRETIRDAIECQVVALV